MDYKNVLHSLFLGFEHSFLKNFEKQLFGSVIFAPKAHLYQVLQWFLQNNWTDYNRIWYIVPS